MRIRQLGHKVVDFLCDSARIFHDNRESGLSALTEDEYRNSLLNSDGRGQRSAKTFSKAKAAFEKAWEIRNFEIELYWKRASYFWAFIASAFVGFFALTGSKDYGEFDRFDHVEVFLVACIGFILSVAWFLTNKGSKSWQRHWETHVDMLEDQFTGPLYKTVYPQMTYSVSKINEIVSVVIAAVWALLGLKYLIEQDLLNWPPRRVNWFVVAALLGTLCAIIAMVNGYGRGRFSKRKVIMYRRDVSYNDRPTEQSRD